MEINQAFLGAYGSCHWSMLELNSTLPDARQLALGRQLSASYLWPRGACAILLKASSYLCRGFHAELRCGCVIAAGVGVASHDLQRPGGPHLQLPLPALVRHCTHPIPMDAAVGCTTQHHGFTSHMDLPHHCNTELANPLEPYVCLAGHSSGHFSIALTPASVSPASPGLLRRWTSALEWHGQDGFNRAPKEDWRVDDELAGFIQRHERFANVEILDAGHMVRHLLAPD